MRPVVVGLALAIGASAACKGGDSKPTEKTAAPASDPKEEVIKGKYATAKKVADGRYVLTEERLPDKLGDGEHGGFSIDGDDDAPIDGGGTGPEQRGAGGSGKKRFGQSPLYVDGQPVAVVAYGELPAWLPTRPVKLGDGRMATRFRLAEYFTALGVDVARVREVHFYGGRGRIAIMPGEELRRLEASLYFSFTEGEAGKMRMHWDGNLKVSDTIDKVQAVAIYIDKVPPKWSIEKWGLLDDKGEKYQGIPFVEHPLRGGLRMYLDGRILHVLKRKEAFDRKVQPHSFVDGVPHFRLFDYLEENGYDVSAVTALELLSGNDIVLRLDGPALASERATIELSAPQGQSGHVLVHVGKPDARRALEITSIGLLTAARARAKFRRK